MKDSKVLRVLAWNLFTEVADLVVPFMERIITKNSRYNNKCHRLVEHWVNIPFQIMMKE